MRPEGQAKGLWTTGGEGEMATKGGQDKMAVVDVNWFFSEENLAKLSDEDLLFILHDLLEIQKEKRGVKADDAG
jgi:hypothetical protein